MRRGAAALAVAAGATGCAGAVVDGARAGERVAAVVEERTGRPATAECDGGADLREGSRFRCRVTFDDGERRTVQVRVGSSSGTFDIVDGLDDAGRRGGAPGTTSTPAGASAPAGPTSVTP
ncbi:MAG: DUF4333 domain-containing protein [Solirubrobacteraceae bacterium]|nr:DUF4333 domain-containing protein [Solirubrobacteraceae bacterium]